MDTLPPTPSIAPNNAYNISEEQALALKTACGRIAQIQKALNTKKNEMKELNKMVKPLKEDVLKFMVARKIPTLECESMTFNVVKPKAKNNPKVKDVMEAAEKLMGKSAAETLKSESETMVQNNTKKKRTNPFVLKVIAPVNTSSHEIFEQAPDDQ